jgi:lysophospholipase
VDDFWGDYRRFPVRVADADKTAVLERRFLEPPDFEWGVFTTADGRALRWGRRAAGSPRAHCVLVGGFTEFVEKYFETIGDLVARDISVWCLDWHGQGGSQRPPLLPSRPRPRLFDRDASDLAQFTEALVPASRQRILIAHSMGGAIALLCLRTNPSLFDIAILSAPMLGLATGGIPAGLARLIAGTITQCGLGALLVLGARQWRSDASLSPAASRTSSDPKRCRVHQAWLAARPGLTLDGPTYGWVDAAFRLTARVQHEEFLAGIATPVLIGSAGNELFVDRQAHRLVARCLRDCEVVDLPQSKHEPFLETDPVRDRWFAAIDQFLDLRLTDSGRWAIRTGSVGARASDDSRALGSD